MKIDKWVRFRIMLVAMGIYLFFFIMFLRFMYLQLGGRVVICTIIVIVAISTTVLIFGNLFLVSIDQLYDIKMIYKGKELTYRGSKLPIVNLLTAKKIKVNVISYMILFFTLLMNIFINYYYDIELNKTISIAILILIIVIMMNQKIPRI